MKKDARSSCSVSPSLLRLAHGRNKDGDPDAHGRRQLGTSRRSAQALMFTGATDQAAQHEIGSTRTKVESFKVAQKV